LSKNVAIFIDVANLYYSARGQDVDVDYVALLKAATKGRDLIRAYAYSGLDPENENQRKFIDFLTKNGYKVVHKDIRKFGDGRVKANLDIELVVDLFRLQDRMDIAVIVSGDGDFAPAIRALQDVGVRCEVISFRPNTSSDLLAVADEFTDIMKIASISREKAAKGMSAPAMPAKEVEPDFAFRDASPAVAAAALAAIRGGDATHGPRGGRGRTTTTRRRSEPAAAEKAEAAASIPASAAAVHEANGHESNGHENGHEDGEHRRRRRRGGRGRGRRGHAESDETTTTPATETEVGWQEFDDLSQLDGLEEERSYTFEEADAATLAELGLLDDAPVAPEVDAAAESGEEASKPRRSRGRKASDVASVTSTETADEAPTDTSTEAPKPKRGRPRKAATAQADAPTGEGATARRPRARKPAEATSATETAEKPKRSRSRRSADESKATPEASGPGSSDGEAEPQGIWGRFRSARTTR
jgi:uncharacterized LabA/DUF88 family protein